MNLTTSQLLEWRVMTRPLDDWDNRPTPEVQRQIIDECVAAFRARLEDALRRGELVAGFGPTIS